MKKLFAAILITATLLLISGCGENNQQTAQQQDQNTQQTNTINQVPVENQVDIPKEVESFDKLYTKENLSHDDCNTLKEQNLIDLCNSRVYTTEAVGKLDSNICEKITTNYEKSECKTRVKFFRDSSVTPE